jgi:gas vesicle protein
MSYAGPSRTRGTARTTPTPSTGRAAPVRRPEQSPASVPADETDWQQVAIFGVGVAFGLAVGAGAALLSAPRSGAETRAALRARAGRVGRTTRRRGLDAWDDLRDELHGARRALQRRKARRAAERDLRREAELEVE